MRLSLSLPSLLAGLLATTTAAAGCSSCRHAAPEPIGEGPDAAAASSASTGAPSPGVSAWLARHPRDDAGHLIPRSSPPPVASSALPPVPAREPDWDLDPVDPARDYVRRYVIITHRYGETLDCVELGESREAGDRRRVEVRTAASCPGAGAVRDVFLVDPGADRLSVDDRAKRDPLARWPDGSDPEGPASQAREAGDTHGWQGALKDAIRVEQLVAIRVQAYGRGSYPLVTLAGWHAAVMPTASPDDLRPFAEKLCRASGGLPLAFVAGLDRSTVLRIRCPGTARWDRL
jgi:hypothetical protein